MYGIMLCDDILEMIGKHHVINTHKQKMASVLDDIKDGMGSLYWRLEPVIEGRDCEEVSTLDTLIQGGYISFSDYSGPLDWDEFDWCYSYRAMRTLHLKPPHLITCGTYYQHLIYGKSHGEDFMGSVLEVVRDDGS